MKTCARCRNQKSPEAFSKNAKAKDGLNSWCKSCDAEYRVANSARLRAQKAARYAANPEPARQRSRARYAADPVRGRAAAAQWAKEHPDRVLANRRAWRQANPERARELSARWEKAHPDVRRAAQAKHHAAHPEARRLRVRKWQQANPESVTASKHRRRARVLNAPGNGVTAAQWRDVLAGSLGLCVYCNERRPLEMEHVEPLSRGGAHDPENIAAACLPCNRSKSDTPLIAWMAHRAASRTLAQAA